jgi:hypothetical protein
VGGVTLRPAVRFGLAASLVLFGLAAFEPSLDVLLVLALVALLVLRELAGRGLDARERIRVDYLIGLGFLAFVVIVVQRVVQILA